MGRYYSGDIEGKFWFALQSSDAPTRFGGTIHEPQTITFCFYEDDLPDVEKEIDKIEKSLGDKKEKIDKFFEGNSGWNDDMLKDAGISKDDLSDYADLGLGIKIRDCIKETGQCVFEGEY